MHGIIAIVQLILHYLGLAGIIFGIIAYLFGNSGRGSELLIGGIALIVLKYIIGFIYLGLRGNEDKKENSQQTL